MPLPSEVVPLGGIIQWSGAILDIPAGWQICDGTDGTPDLRNKFVVGAGDTYAVDAEGGALTHDHAFTGDGHAHAPGATAQAVSGAIIDVWDDVPSASANAAGTTDADGALPPFYALAWIQRMV